MCKKIFKKFQKPIDKRKDKWYNVQAVREKDGTEGGESAGNLILEN